MPVASDAVKRRWRRPPSQPLRPGREGPLLRTAPVVFTARQILPVIQSCSGDMSISGARQRVEGAQQPRARLHVTAGAASPVPRNLRGVSGVRRRYWFECPQPSAWFTEEGRTWSCWCSGNWEIYDNNCYWIAYLLRLSPNGDWIVNGIEIDRQTFP